MFKTARQRQLIALVIWCFIIFFAVIKLPAVTHLITSVNQSTTAPSQIAGSRQLTNAHQIQDHWGRHLDHSRRLNLVYHRAGKINPGQQAKVNQIAEVLRTKRSQLGIRRVTNVNNVPYGSRQFISRDGSTEVLRLRIRPRSSFLKQVQNIKKLTHVGSLQNDLTGPQLLQQIQVRHVINSTKAATIAGLLLAGLAIGISCRLLIIPLPMLITLLSVDLISLSLICSLAARKVTGITSLTPLTVLLTVLITGTVYHCWLGRAITRELPRYRNATDATTRALKTASGPIISSGLTLTAALGGLFWMPNPPLRDLAILSIPNCLTAIATLTMTPALVARLGSFATFPTKRHHYHGKVWKTLTKTALWQPIIGILLIICVIIPFFRTSWPNLNHAETSKVNGQAQRGERNLNTYFGAGTTRSVELNLHNPKAFNQEGTLKPLGTLTDRLRTVPNVKTVTSLTNPGGRSVSKYQLSHQLGTAGEELNQTQHQLRSQMPRLKNSRKLVDSGAENGSHLRKLDGKLAQDQFSSTHRKIIHQLLNQLHSLAPGATRSARQIKKQLTSAQEQLRSGTERLQDTNRNIKNSVKAAGGIYSITPDQLEDSDFRQSKFNFTSRDQKATRLLITFKRVPTPEDLRQLATTEKSQLRGTPLASAKIGLNGQPVWQARLQHNYRAGAPLAILISGGILLLGIVLLSHSLTQPLAWLSGIILSGLVGTQAARLINPQPLSGTLTASLAEILISAITTELTPLALSYRNRTDDERWLHQTLPKLGRTITPISLITVLIMAGGFLQPNVIMLPISLVTTGTVVAIDVLLPLAAGASGKLALTPPHRKTGRHRFRQLLHKITD